MSIKSDRAKFQQSMFDENDILNTHDVLDAGIRFLLSNQAADGSWEGEVIWCPVLTAQYTIMCYIVGLCIHKKRREAILRQFQSTRLPNGLWGLHEKAEPSLFVTTLVYVSSRILGIGKDEELLINAFEFIRNLGGVTSIPSWGKFWLSMLNLYKWNGCNPVLPETWALPKCFFFHPSYYYCHTRAIYMGMAYIYGQKFQVPVSPLIETLRTELYEIEYQLINFDKARTNLRKEEICSPPSLRLKIIYQLCIFYENFHFVDFRKRVLNKIIDHIHFELNTTNFTCISPVSGLLNMIALWLHEPDNFYFEKTIEKLEDWMWEDTHSGLRIAGARSETWDTSFAIQALQQAAKVHMEITPRIEQGQKFLASQQIVKTLANNDEFYRGDSKGGFCFAGIWHGWPVSDCTAEALLALMNQSSKIMTSESLLNAVNFIIRCQNTDGGFGSYERRRMAATLDWMNPAEIFSNSMTELSYIECTASCVAALSEFCRLYPELANSSVSQSIERARSWLIKKQYSDGSWHGFWGVNFIYGTMFAIHGLLSANIQPSAPVIQKACSWLVSKQKSDGGWGEHFQGCLSNSYIEHNKSQVIHTSWAMIALLKASYHQWESIEKGAHFLLTMQMKNGSWPKQDPAGVFFSSALLDYSLYRSYFPVWAMGLFESKRLQRKVENEV